eukprot:COSAG01_NODE_74615_length_206_cov_529.542056_1_plen_49_part_10
MSRAISDGGLGHRGHAGLPPQHAPPLRLGRMFLAGTWLVVAASPLDEQQ